MIHHDFAVHWAGIFLFLLLLACRAGALRRRVPVLQTIAVNRPYLCAGAYRERNCTDQNRNPFLHVPCMFL